jgi:hypothetical protein
MGSDDAGPIIRPSTARFNGAILELVPYVSDFRSDDAALKRRIKSIAGLVCLRSLDS